MPQLCFSTPLGEITVTEEDGALVSLDWGQGAILASSPLLEKAKEQIQSYFTGQRRTFDLPLRPFGTPFQNAVWREISAIPFGQTQTYGVIAARLQTSPRAVGGACGRNPLPLVIPCHRVLATDGGLGGYSGDGGVETKRWLLRHEQRVTSD